MEIYTNGATEPSIALFLSAKILKDMAAKISLFEIEPQYIRDIELDPELEMLERKLAKSVREIELSVRAANCLSQAKIETIGDLVSKTEAEMLKFRNFGKKSLEEINQKLKTYDLHLGMDVESIYRQIREARSRGVLPVEEKETKVSETKTKSKSKTKTVAEKPVPKAKKIPEPVTTATVRKPVPSPKKKVEK